MFIFFSCLSFGCFFFFFFFSSRRRHTRFDCDWSSDVCSSDLALVSIGAKTMLQHVYERVSLARYLTNVIIATDDQRIYDEARRFGALVRMTRADHLSGTDRVAEVASADTAEW